GTPRMRDNRMQDATFCSCFHVFMAQIIAVINNSKNKMAGQDQDEAEAKAEDEDSRMREDWGCWIVDCGLRTGNWDPGAGIEELGAGREEPKDELKDVDADAISTEFCSINDKL
ncbi:hypothetical protein KR009_001879, partial [Drosophila setifemur]